MKFNAKHFFYPVLSVFVALVSYFYQASSMNLQVLFNTQQPDFLFDSDYFYRFLSMHGGISEYLSKFLLQFFEFPIAGSIVVAVLSGLLFSVAYLLFKDILRGVIIYFACLLPVIVFNFLFTNPYYPLSSAISIILAFGAVLLFKIWSNNKRVLIPLAIVLPPFVYFIVCSGAFMLFLTSSIVILLICSSVKQKWIAGIILLIMVFAIPYLSFHFIWNTTYLHAFYSFLPDVSIHLRYVSNNVFILFKYLIPTILIVALLFKIFVKTMPQIRFLKNIYIPMALFFIITAGMVFYVSNISKPTVINTRALIDYYGYKGDWQKVEEIAMANPYDLIINYYYVRSIDNQGGFLERFFNYPQYVGADILFPDKFDTGDMALFSSDYYYELGYYAESLHWAYETYTRNLYDKRVLKRLVELNYILHNNEAANFFLETLKKCMNTEEFVNKYSVLLQEIKKEKLLENLSIQNNLKDSIVIAGEFNLKCKALLLMDSTNKKAYEHLQMHYLLNHQLGDFVNTFNKYPLFNKGILSNPFADGVILYLLKTKQNDFNKYSISKSSYKKFSDFSKVLNEQKGNKERAKAILKPYYSNTFLYYMYFDSPKVTNRSIGKKEDIEYQN